MYKQQQRFGFSPFRNATLKEAHREHWTSLGAACVADGLVPVVSGATGTTHVCVGRRSIFTTHGLATAATDDAAALCVAAGGAVVGASAGGVSVLCGAAWTRVAAVGAAHIAPHPSAPLVAAALGAAVALVDLSAGAQVAAPNPAPAAATVQALAFARDAALLATANADNLVRVWDPRAAASSPLTTAAIHAGVKPSTVVWLNGSATFLTAGFSKSRDRELAVWDMRNLSSPATPILKLDTSTGLLLPLFDPDSGLLFVTGKGDSVIRTFEVSSANGLTQTPTSFVSSTQIQGACLSSKWALNVMDCEINRIMVVGRSSNSSTDDSLVPISVGVMRKNKMDFQEDLFPDTFVGEDGVVGVSVDAWLKGENAVQPKASLNPKVRATSGGGAAVTAVASTATTPGVLSQQNSFVAAAQSPTRSSTAAAPAPVPAPVPIVASSQRPSAVASVPAAAPAFPSAVQSTPISKPSSTTTAPAASTTSATKSTTTTAPVSNVPSSSTPTSPKPPLKLPQQSSFKYIAGTQIKHFEDLRQAAPTLPNECRLLDTNSLYAAFPVSGAGGRIAVWPHAKPGRLPVKLPCVTGGSDITDFSLDKTQEGVLYTLHEDGNLRVWELTESLFVVPAAAAAAAAAAGKGGLLEDLSVPVKVVKVNGGRSGFLVVHSAIRGLVAVASAEPGHYALKVWDLGRGEMVWSVAHPEVVFSAAFSFCGTKIVSVCKDGKVRVIGLKSGMVVGEAGAHERGSKGARVAWIGSGDLFLSCGFGRANQRELRVYNSNDLSQTAFVTAEMSPSLITPYVDESLPIVFLVGKGESYIQVFHIELNESGSGAAADGIVIKAVTKVATYTASAPQMGASFVPKLACNVADVEVARCYRLTSNAIEQVSFKLPRLKKEYFQDDLFPPLTANKEIYIQQWRDTDSNRLSKQVIDLCPPGMTPLSSVKNTGTGSNTPTQGRSSATMAVELSEAQKKQAAMEQMKRLAMADDDDVKMVQDKFEGVDDDEWDD